MMSEGRKCDEELDALGLLACQDYNLGNQGNWFFSFRSGFSGFHSRMASLEEHRALVYEWHPNALLPGHERHIAIILFCMDSAFECTVFALNALGQARQPTGFRTVTDEGALRQISPRDVTCLRYTEFTQKDQSGMAGLHSFHNSSVTASTTWLF
jgi:hypothetical protein